MTATLVFNADLGNYSLAVGAAQRLSNGNYSFTSGWQGQAPNLFGQTIEVRPDGSKAYVLQMNHTEFRSYWLRTLYEGTSDQLAGNGEGTSATDAPRGKRHGRSSEAAEPFRDGHAEPAAAEAGSANVARALPGAGGPAPAGNGTGASPAPAGDGSPDDFWVAVATALAASSGQVATPITPWTTPPTAVAPASGQVERLDQLFATGGEGRRLALFRAQPHPPSWADDPRAAGVGIDGTLDDGPFPAVSKN
jgi:hypothetical protein